MHYIYSFKNLFYKLSFGQRPRKCLNKSYSNSIDNALNLVE